MSKIKNNPLNKLVSGDNSDKSKKDSKEPLEIKRAIKKYPLSIPTELHGKIKIKAFTEGFTMNEFIVKILEKNI